VGIFKSIYTENMESADMEDPSMPENEAPKELLDAEERCPEVKFVKSCREFFDRRGFLSVAQRNALRYSGTPYRRQRQHYGDEPYKCDRDAQQGTMWESDGADPSDWGDR
jgi:hypothetical protein